MPFEVLVVDDNDDCRDVQVMILTEAGYGVSEARNGLEALERVRSAQPDLIIMDIHMPVMDGLTATRELHADEEIKRIPVIAQTANVNALQNDRELFYGVVQKPADPEEILRLVASALQGCTA